MATTPDDLMRAFQEFLSHQQSSPSSDRKCRECGQSKKLSEFRQCGASPEVRRHTCIECQRRQQRGRDRAAARDRVAPVMEPTQPVVPMPYSGKARIAAEYRERTTQPPPSVFASDIGVSTYVVVSDVHVPYHDRHCTDAVTRLCEDISPTGMVIAGDFVDFYELSTHNAQSVARLEGRRITDTYAAGNELLDEWRWATDFLDGNHEGRLADWLHTGDNAAWLGDESVNIAHRLRFAERGITHHVGEHNYKRLGKLLVTHGRWTNKYHANKHLDEYRHSVIYGHTHSPQTLFASAYGSQQCAIGMGHLADPDSEAMSYAAMPNRWCQGFALVHVYPDETFRVMPINFWRQSFVYGGKHYGRRPAVQVL